MLAVIVSLLHFIVLFWALVAPFTKELRVSYFLLMPVIMLHWVLLDDSCILTVLENHIRGTTNDESFVYRFVSKIYNVPEGFVGSLMWAYAVTTWVYVCFKLTKEDFSEAFKY